MKAVSAANPALKLRNAPRMAVSDGGGRKEVEKELIKNFLTQRAVQTHLTTLNRVGDVINFEYLERFGEHEGLSQVHGYGALKMSWREYLSELQIQPEVVVEKKKKTYRGGSANNPYLQDNYVTYEERVEPRDLAMTLLDWRADLSKEWLADLELIPQENAEAWRHHLAMVQNASDPDLQNQYSLLQLDDSSTPMRSANYDLLNKFCTHIAADKVLSELAKKTSEERSAVWLRDFMSEQGIGNTKAQWGMGASFLRNMLNEPPKVISEDGDMKLIDPLDLAARVMAERQVISELWIDAMEEVQDDHLDLHRKFMENCFVGFGINLEIGEA